VAGGGYGFSPSSFVVQLKSRALRVLPFFASAPLVFCSYQVIGLADQSFRGVFWKSKSGAN
jgi:hypothetical protein